MSLPEPSGPAEASSALEPPDRKGQGQGAPAGWLQVRNWKLFQHYRKRSPPWIKVYTELLDDYDFAALPPLSQLALLKIWLLAGRQNNRLPNDPFWIQSRAGLSEPPDLPALIAGGWLETLQNSASILLASGASKALDSAEERQRRGEETASTAPPANLRAMLEQHLGPPPQPKEHLTSGNGAAAGPDGLLGPPAASARAVTTDPAAKRAAFREEAARARQARSIPPRSGVSE